MSGPAALAQTDAAAQRDARIDAIRRFSRFFTSALGALRDGFLDRDVSLAEARVLFEIAECERNDAPATAAAIAGELQIDPGYLSRMVKRFERAEWITRRPSETDARQQTIALTADGRRISADLDERSRSEVGVLLDRLPPVGQERVAAALATAQRTLSIATGASINAETVIRAHRRGEIGWVLSRHATFYCDELGWGAAFETLVAQICADFLATYDPSAERCFIAEQAGAPVGSAMLVRDDAETARIRLVLVEPTCRGQGLGRDLVRACLSFARDAGYRRVTLWTNDGLATARRLYETEGFQLVSEEPHAKFEIPMIGQTWTRNL